MARLGRVLAGRTSTGLSDSLGLRNWTGGGFQQSADSALLTGDAVAAVRTLNVRGDSAHISTGPQHAEGEVNTITGTSGPDTLTGTAGQDAIYGLEGNDVLDGAGGGDTLVGGTGDDTYVMRSTLDVVTETAGEGFDTLFTVAFGYTLAENQEIEWLSAHDIAGTANYNFTGNSIAQTLVGNNGANVLNGLGGADTMIGYRGNDTYVVDNAGDVVVELAGIVEGNDIISATVSYTLGAGVHVELLQALPTAGTSNIDLTGNELNNAIAGNNGSNILDGAAGADRMTGFGGNDTFYVDNAGDIVEEAMGGISGSDKLYTSVSYTIDGVRGVEWLSASLTTGTDALDIIVTATGGSLNQTLLGNYGANQLDGGQGADTMAGYLGDDSYYVDNAGDIVTEAAGEGFDRVLAKANYTLTAGASVERLSTDLSAGTAAINLTGNELGQAVVGNRGINILRGEGGDDLLIGFAGTDTLTGGTGADKFRFVSVLDGNDVDTVTDFTSEDKIELSIATFTQVGPVGALNPGSFVIGIDAGDADDRIIYDSATGRLYYDADGNGTGAAVLFAMLQGNPALAASDVMVVAGDGDAVNTITGTAGPDNLIGTAGQDVIYGLADNDYLYGAGGGDTLVGGAGNDIYAMDSLLDVVIETAGEGFDVLYTNFFSYTLAEDQEIEWLSTNYTAGTGNFNFTGNSIAQTLIGTNGENILDGRGGADTMVGYGRNDTYYVDDAGDLVVELEGAPAGNDIINTSVSYTLRAGVYVELLQTVSLTAVTSINLTGNEIANRLIGNNGANILNGGAGADRMTGFGGDDIYIIDNVGDIAEEQTTGFDIVYTSISYTIEAVRAIEWLSTTQTSGTDAIDIIVGVSSQFQLNQTLLGNYGANVLDGGQGADVMVGFLGDDTFYVDNAGDVVGENTGEGFDRILSTTSYTLAAGVSVERLSTILNAATTAINLTGNELDQTVVGNMGANVLNGGGGADVLIGFGGTDTLTGGTGADRFRFVSVLGDVDTVTDFTSGDGIELSAASFTQIGAVGALNPNAFVLGTAAADADDRIIYNAATGQLYYDADGTGAGAQLLFAVLQGNPALTASDFTVVAGNDDVVNTITGTAGPDNLIGTAGPDVIYGLEGNDYLDGAGGGDRLIGGAGDDVYAMTSILDVVVETAGEGFDAILTNFFSYTLAEDQEIEWLSTNYTAGTGNFNFTGNSIAQTILGNNGSNILDGRGGADTMVGFRGGDIYYVDNPGDVVVEEQDGGGGAVDIIRTTVSYVLGAGVYVELVEAVDVAGTTSLDLTGNELGNQLYANNGKNVLDGGAGADTMTGFGGGDIYIVDNVGDIIQAGNGFDVMYTKVSYTIDAVRQVEWLSTIQTTATDAINIIVTGTGATLNQTLVGNFGANTLDGGTGVDIMVGFLGDDIYFVDNAGDVVGENSGEGSDTVQASVNYTLAAGVSVESLSTTLSAGTTALNLTGNELGQSVVGNNGANVLRGEGGDDVLVGFGGGDTLTGGSGADAFRFVSVFGGTDVDAITDFASGDRIELAAAAFTQLGGAGALNPNAFVLGTSAGDADDRIIYNAATGQLYYDADGSGAGAQVLFATLTGNPALAASDFLVI